MAQRSARKGGGRMVAALVVVSFCVSSAGCSRSGPELIDVRGRVTFNGLPARAELHFEPVREMGTKKGGRASIGTTDSDGWYRLAFTAGRYGAAPGKHRVMLRVLRPMPADGKATFEAMTGAIKTVELERTVGPDSDRFDFAVVW